MSTTAEVYLNQRADEITDAYSGVEVLYHEGRMELSYREEAAPTWKVDGQPRPVPVPLPDISIPALGEALAAWRQVRGDPKVTSESLGDGVRVWHIESAEEGE